MELFCCVELKNATKRFSRVVAVDMAKTYRGDCRKLKILLALGEKLLVHPSGGSGQGPALELEENDGGAGLLKCCELQCPDRLTSSC